MSPLLWPPARLPQTLDSGCVHVWAWDFSCDARQLIAATSLLSPEEQQRMRRFHFERHRVRYAVCHANLRRVLGSYLELQPSLLQFEENSYGKPALRHGEPSGRSKDTDLNFNLSHTTDVALLAVGRDIELGIDVEQIRPIEPEIVERYFSLREIEQLARLTGPAWLEGFYNCWTRKEAILKAEGVGLSLGLDSFDVSLNPGDPPRLIDARNHSSRADSGLTTDWILAALKPVEDASAAIATNHHPGDLRCWRLAPVQEL